MEYVFIFYYEHDFRWSHSLPLRSVGSSHLREAKWPLPWIMESGHDVIFIKSIIKIFVEIIINREIMIVMTLISDM